MKRLNFETLYIEKVNQVMQSIGILADINESDTIVPPKFFDSANKVIIKDHDLKMKLLNKNTKFCVRELKKDHKTCRKLEKVIRKKERLNFRIKSVNEVESVLSISEKAESLENTARAKHGQ